MGKKLHVQKINYSYKDLAPVMSEDTLKYHRDKLAASYVKRYNNDEGDADFNEAGAFLHNIFFPQLKEPSSGNKPEGACLEIINKKYKDFDSFKKEFAKVAMSIQGSGWVYMDTSGEIKTISNHQIKNNIALLVDWWEHAWALDYQQDKKKYLNNIWKIINWDVVSDRLNIKKGSSAIKELVRLANHLDKIGCSAEANLIDDIIKASSQI